MFASRVQRRFYRAFFRWNHSTSLLNHSAYTPRRMLSSSARRETSANDEAPSDEPIPPQENFQGSLAGDNQDAKPVPEDDKFRRKLRATVRNMFRCVPQPVAIVTALDPSSDSDGGMQTVNEWEEALNSLRAMTISSLNTVSLDPTTVISFNVRLPSSTWDAISKSGRVRVSLMDSTERAEEIATLFAQGNSTAGFSTLLKQGTPIRLNRPGGQLLLDSHTAEWSVDPKMIDPNPAPFIKSKALEGCILAEVLPEKCVQVNDHVIVVAEVKQVQAVSRMLAQSGDNPRYPVLSYFNHRYVTVGRPVTVDQPDSQEVVTAPRNVRKQRRHEGLIRKVRTEVGSPVSQDEGKSFLRKIVVDPRVLPGTKSTESRADHGEDKRGEGVSDDERRFFEALHTRRY
ncbi:hypothetical protein SLS58_009837 [Diplodia intermedia]|uniref:Flavin reductase like domain-containing protein n=1 Tax=Diplodia intermedia TaxID=856260 RepID=A0ABR3T9X3_9PEZI